MCKLNFSGITTKVTHLHSVCDRSVQFTSLHFTSLHFTSFHFSFDLFYSVLFCSVQLSSGQFCSVHFSSVTFSPVQFCSVLFSSVQFCSVQSKQNSSTIYKLCLCLRTNFCPPPSPNCSLIVPIKTYSCARHAGIRIGGVVTSLFS